MIACTAYTPAIWLDSAAIFNCDLCVIFMQFNACLALGIAVMCIILNYFYLFLNTGGNLIEKGIGLLELANMIL